MDFDVNSETISSEINKEEVVNLVSAAIEARSGSYAPYSKFRVGAALKLKGTSTIFTGANVENASYGATICAERAAILKAINLGFDEIEAIAVCGFFDEMQVDERGFAYPCGVCRQVINEFIGENTRVIVAKDVENYKIHKFSELLQFAFGPLNLD